MEDRKYFIGLLYASPSLSSFVTVATRTNEASEKIMALFNETQYKFLMRQDENTMNLIQEVFRDTCKESGNAELIICTAYDIFRLGEQASGYVFDVYKMDSSDGKVVYYNNSSGKYHYSADCAGPSAMKTTYYDVKCLEADPCGKCVD